MISAKARTPEWPKGHASALGQVGRFQPVEHDPFEDLAHVAAEGRRGDKFLGHLAPNDVVVPHELQTPTVKRFLKLLLAEHLARFTVGKPENSRNPKTGLIEFEAGGDGGGGGDGGDGGGDSGSAGDGGGDNAGNGGNAGNSGGGGSGDSGGNWNQPPEPVAKPAVVAPAAPPVVPMAPTPAGLLAWGSGGPWSAGGVPPQGPFVPGGGVLPGNGTPPGQPIPASVLSMLSAASGNPLGVTVPQALPGAQPAPAPAAAGAAPVPAGAPSSLANFGTNPLSFNNGLFGGPS